jgi:hypothetical protein
MSELYQQCLRNRLERNTGHNMNAHKGRAFSQSGFAQKCARCSILKKIKPIEIDKMEEKE